MPTNLKQDYDSIIKKFVNDNMSILLAGKKYRVSDSEKESALHYMPEHNQKAEPNYIGDTSQFDKLVNTIFDSIVNRNGLSFNFKGHHKKLDGKTLSEFIDQRSFFSRDNLIKSFSIKILIDVFKAFLDVRDKNNKETNYFMFLWGNNLIELPSYSQCDACDAYLTLVIDGSKNEITVLEHEKNEGCPVKTKIKKVSVTLKSPSGKLVFLNHPHEFFKIENDYDAPSINSTLGCIEKTKSHATHNIGYFCVGNTSIHIMQKDSKILATNYDQYDRNQIKKFQDYKYHGYVCCDVWWYTVLDYDLYVKLCDEQKVDPKSITHTIVEIGKDKYKITHKLDAHEKGHYYGTHSTITY